MTKIFYSKEYKDQVVKRAEEIGVNQAAKEFNISAQNVYRWINKTQKEQCVETGITDENSVEKVTEEPVKYNDQLIERVLMRVKDVGVKIAAFEFSVPLEKVEQWAEEEKSKVKESIVDVTGDNIEDVVGDNKEETVEDVSKKSKKGIRYSDELKAEILKRADEIGITKAAAEYNVAYESIRKWKAKAKTDEVPAAEIIADDKREAPAAEVDATAEMQTHDSMSEEKTDKPKDTVPEYSNEFISRVLQRADEVGVRQAAEENNVIWQKVAGWKKKAKRAYESEKMVEAADNISESADMVQEETVKNEVTEPERKVPITTQDITSKTQTVEEFFNKTTGRSLEIENAVLKSENAALKVQVERLKKALRELM